MSWLRWVIVLAAVLVVIGLLSYARGEEHMRGDEVGAIRSAAVLTS
jgi:hypothetical protein